MSTNTYKSICWIALHTLM